MIMSFEDLFGELVAACKETEQCMVVILAKGTNVAKEWYLNQSRMAPRKKKKFLKQLCSLLNVVKQINGELEKVADRGVRSTDTSYQESEDTGDLDMVKSNELVPREGLIEHTNIESITCDVGDKVPDNSVKSHGEVDVEQMKWEGPKVGDICEVTFLGGEKPWSFWLDYRKRISIYESLQKLGRMIESKPNNSPKLNDFVIGFINNYIRGFVLNIAETVISVFDVDDGSVKYLRPNCVWLLEKPIELQYRPFYCRIWGTSENLAWHPDLSFIFQNMLANASLVITVKDIIDGCLPLYLVDMDVHSYNDEINFNVTSWIKVYIEPVMKLKVSESVNYKTLDPYVLFEEKDLDDKTVSNNIANSNDKINQSSFVQTKSFVSEREKLVLDRIQTTRVCKGRNCDMVFLRGDSPTSFLLSFGMEENVNDIKIIIDEQISSGTIIKQKSIPDVGSYVVVKKNLNTFRGIIVCGDVTAKLNFNVFDIDTGSVSNCRLEEIWESNHFIRSIPSQTLLCCLHGLPNNQVWPSDVMNKFHSLMKGNKLFVNIRDIIDSDYHKHFILIDVFINNDFVDVGKCLLLKLNQNADMSHKKEKVKSTPLPCGNKHGIKQKTIILEELCVMFGFEPRTTGEVNLDVCINTHKTQDKTCKSPVKYTESSINNISECVIESYDALFEIGEEYDVTILSFENPSEMYIRLVSDKIASENLTKQMFSHYTKYGEYFISISNFKHCVKKYCAVDCGSIGWHRGEIRNRVDNSKYYHVFLIDRGYEIVTWYKKIQPLHRDFMKIPRYALTCKLANILPLDSGNSWSQSVIEELWLMTDMKSTYTMYVHSKEIDSGIFNILLTDVKNKNMSLNKLLVQKGLAVSCEVGANSYHFIEYPDVAESESGLSGISDISGNEDNDTYDVFDDTLAELEMPSVGHILEIVLTEVISDKTFYAQVRNVEESVDKKDSFTILECLNKHINNLYKSRQLRRVRRILPGMLVLARYSYDKLFYRAMILNCDEANGKVEVTFVDYGNSESVRFRHIKQIPKDMKVLPAQAVQFTLDKSDSKLVKGKKKQKRIKRLQSLIGVKYTRAEILDTDSVSIRVRFV